MPKPARASVSTTHNEPSNLSPVEKQVRRRRRFLTREIAMTRKRISRFSRISENPRNNPIQRATATAEVALAEQRLGQLEKELRIVEIRSVN